MVIKYMIYGQFELNYVVNIKYIQILNIKYGFKNVKYFIDSISVFIFFNVVRIKLKYMDYIKFLMNNVNYYVFIVIEY